MPTPTARVKILTLTAAGAQYLQEQGISVPSAGRGGAAHEYWRQTLRHILERHGYTATEEFPIGEGRAVDLHATRNDHEVFVEIETGKSDIQTNITKCTGLPGTVVFFFVSNELRDAWANELDTGQAFTPTDLDQFATLIR